jgi:hypothetical protein
VESYLKRKVEALGGACEKFKSATRGDPDRLMSFPWQYHCLAETKWAEGVSPEPHQIRRHQWWTERGIDVWVLRSKREVDVFIEQMEFREIIHEVSR